MYNGNIWLKVLYVQRVYMGKYTACTTIIYGKKYCMYNEYIWLEKLYVQRVYMVKNTV
jgi:hypothetical protein